MKTLYLIPVLLSLFLIPSPQTGTKSLVLKHVTVVDVTADQRLKALKVDQAVVITGNQITAIGQADKIRVPQGAQIVDAGGRYLIPGLWDMHVHSLVEGRPDYFFPLFIANGVTGVRDMGGSLPFERIRQIRNDLNSGKLIGPRLGAVAGKILDGPGTQLNVGMSVTNTNQARQIVRSFKQSGADFIKVYDRLSRDVYLAIVDEARKEKIPVAGHVPFESSAAEVSDEGQKSIEHAMDIFISASVDEKRLREDLRRGNSTEINAPRMQVELKAVSAYDEKRSKSLFARFASNNTWQCPTLIVRRSSSHGNNERLAADPRMKYIPKSTRNSWDQMFRQRFASGTVEQRLLRFQTFLLVVGAMQRANVQILAGTDILNPYVFPGFSLHEELALLVDAGLTPMQALRTATSNPAKFLGMSDEAGTIEKGKLADLILLDANPLDDIRNTQRIYGVVANGRYFPSQELKALLAQAEANASKQ
ncbi:MAG TPA: amidohydrolase family protein [Pyrinomonadaceae bacterium]